MSMTSYCVYVYIQGTIGDIKLGVSPDKINVPVALLVEGGLPTKQMLFHIDEFDGTSPSSTVFDIPPSCPKSLEPKKIHPMLFQWPCPSSFLAQVLKTVLCLH